MSGSYGRKSSVTRYTHDFAPYCSSTGSTFVTYLTRLEAEDDWARRYCGTSLLERSWDQARVKETPTRELVIYGIRVSAMTLLATASRPQLVPIAFLFLCGRPEQLTATGEIKVYRARQLILSWNSQ